MLCGEQKIPKTGDRQHHGGRDLLLTDWSAEEG